MKEYFTYIFDLDGTLLDTLNDLAVSTNYALHWAGMPEHSVDDVKVFVGNGVKKLIERAMPDGINNPKFEMTYS
ncbi:MAG TPA: HAD hydrolase-like protein, partial [Xylanibacter oryzae]|nr:HAD hydrolase-like protein [Xylanibacter oryzae]